MKTERRLNKIPYWTSSGPGASTKELALETKKRLSTRWNPDGKLFNEIYSVASGKEATFLARREVGIGRNCVLPQLLKRIFLRYQSLCDLYRALSPRWARRPAAPLTSWLVWIGSVLPSHSGVEKGSTKSISRLVSMEGEVLNVIRTSDPP